MKYEIELTSEWGAIEDFEKADDNIVQVKVLDELGNDVSKDTRYAILFLATSNMIELGTKLIRLAHNFEEGKEIRLKPASKEHGAQQELGVFLSPDSCELVIKCESLKPVEEYLKEYKNKADKE